MPSGESRTCSGLRTDKPNTSPPTIGIRSRLPKKQRLWLDQRGKTKPSGENRQFLVAENVTTRAKSKVRKTPLLPTVRKSPLLSISRGGEARAQAERLVRENPLDPAMAVWRKPRLRRSMNAHWE